MKNKKGKTIPSLIIVSLILLQSAAIVGAAAAPGGYTKYFVVGDVVNKDTGSDISGATVKCSADGSLKGQTTTNAYGHFSFSVVLPVSPKSWSVKVSKTGFSTVTVEKRTSYPYTTTNMGTIRLDPNTPSTIQYTTHGYVYNWVSALYTEPLEWATVEIYKEVYEGWLKVGETSSQSNGYFVFSYSSYDTITSFKAIATFGGLSPGSSIVSGTGTDFDLGNLYLAGSFYDVTGSVIDDLTKEQVPSASVAVYSTFSGSEHYLGDATTYDDDGTFIFRFACADTVTKVRVEASKPSYGDGEGDIANENGLGLECNIGDVFLENLPRGYAVIVGISDYQNEGGFDPAVEWCTNDALLWYDYLTNQNDPSRIQFDDDSIWLLGDDQVVGLEWDGIATETNVELALSEMVSQADDNDFIYFMASCHGDYNIIQYEDGYPNPAVAIKLFDFQDIGDISPDHLDNDVVGVLWDYELADILSLTTNERIFIFLDCCSSGGFINDFEALQDDNDGSDVYDRTLFIAGTSEFDGATRGYPSSVSDPNDIEPNHGIWTYVFLSMSLMDKYESSSDTLIDDAYTWANVELDDPDDPEDDTDCTRYHEEFWRIVNLYPPDSDTPTICVGNLMEYFCLFSLI